MSLLLCQHHQLFQIYQPTESQPRPRDNQEKPKKATYQMETLPDVKTDAKKRGKYISSYNKKEHKCTTTQNKRRKHYPKVAGGK